MSWRTANELHPGPPARPASAGVRDKTAWAAGTGGAFMIPSSRSCRRARILCTCPLPMSMSMHEHRTQENTGHYSDHEHGEVQRRVRAPKTLVENRRLAEAITEELGSKDVQKVKGSDLDVFYDRLSRRGLSASSVRRYHAVCSAALNQGVKWGPSSSAPRRRRPRRRPWSATSRMHRHQRRSSS